MEATRPVVCIAGLGDEGLFPPKWLFLMLSALLFAAILIYKPHHNTSVNIKKHFYEVHRISGDKTASVESIKHCIRVLNQFPTWINEPMVPHCYTPFLRACWNGNTPLVRYMLKNGADLHSCSHERENALFLAAFRVIKSKIFNPSVLDLLYLAGCKLSVPNRKGITALMLAARAGNISLTHWLLEHGAHRTLGRNYAAPYYVTMAHYDTGDRYKHIAALLRRYCPEMVDHYKHRKYHKSWASKIEKSDGMLALIFTL